MQHGRERAHVAAHHPSHDRLDDAIEPGRIRARRSACTKCAQIIGVTVSDTTVETTMANTSVTENSRSRRPTTPSMNSSGMKAATSDTLIEIDGEADLPRAVECRPHAAACPPPGCGTCSRS